MDYSCRDIPMRLDIRYQPLSFDVYLSQLIQVPRTSLEEEPYDFKLELEALERVDRIIERTQGRQEKLKPQIPSDQIPSTSISECTSHSKSKQSILVDSGTLPPPPPPPSCPTETPLTPIKSSIGLQQITSNTDGQTSNGNNVANQINLREFEDIDYNPFDHIELQTIDELRELDLVFQASYANQTSNNQVQNTTNDKSEIASSSNTLTKP